MVKQKKRTRIPQSGKNCAIQNVRLSPKGNTGSRLFTEVKPCISGWVTIKIEYPLLYSMGSQAGTVDINHAFHLYYKINVVCGLSFSQSQPDFKGFLRALWFPPSSKLTPSVIHLVVVLCSEVIYGSCSGAERLTGSTALSVRPR